MCSQSVGPCSDTRLPVYYALMSDFDEMLRNLCDDGLQVREPSGLLDLRRLWRAAAAAARAAAERAAERVVGGGE